jgi:uncharacterized protein
MWRPVWSACFQASYVQICSYSIEVALMPITWDERKSRSNVAEHGVSFETAALVFDDPRAQSHLERVVDGEERWQTIGLVGALLILLVVHTWHDGDGEEAVHIISARRATPRERNLYEETH